MEPKIYVGAAVMCRMATGGQCQYTNAANIPSGATVETNVIYSLWHHLGQHQAGESS